MISSTSNFFDSEQSNAKHIAIKSSVRKVNLLANMIKGLSVADASLQLQFSKKKVAYDLKKILNSAVANAENNFGIDIDKLYVASVLVGKAFVLKRLHARARGRAARISKPYSRVEIILKSKRLIVWGKKVNPVGFRLGVINTWDSLWYADRGYADKLHQDLKIRQYITSSFAIAGISKVKIERLAKKVRVIIKSAKPGMIIGKKGEDIAKIKSMIEKITTDEVIVNIVDVKKAEIDANLVATNVAQQLEKRTAFRKAAKRAIQSAMRLGAKGVRLNISGRLGGAEIARTQWYKEGRVPLHTLRAKIGYACASAHTTYGVLGVKVWIYRGERVSSDGLYDD